MIKLLYLDFLFDKTVPKRQPEIISKRKMHAFDKNLCGIVCELNLHFPFFSHNRSL